MSKEVKQFLLFTAVLLLHIPFLFYGYGVEEDSWGHVLNAALIKEGGVYEISRLPGHPLLEGFLWVFWEVHSPLIYNMAAALAGAGSAVVFCRIAEFKKIKNAIWWAFAFSMVPVVFISSTYTIDYSMALFFVLLSYEAALKNKMERAGIWLAVATALRITSLGMLLPLGYLILKEKSVDKSKAIRLRKFAKLLVVSLIASALFYSPIIHQYGFAFFDFHKPPYPNLVEAFYKMSFGAWGVLGTIAVIISISALLAKKWGGTKNIDFVFLILTAIVYLTAYFRMPEKAAFILPIIPFFLLFTAKNVGYKSVKFIIPLLLLSSLFFGINKADKHTGSSHSSLAVLFKSSDGMLFMDPVQGPLFNDLTKRMNKIQACEKIEYKLMIQRQPTLVIAGWWYAMLEVDRRDGKWSNANIRLVYYASPAELKDWQAKGYQLRYLPEQEKVNDKKYQSTFTVENASLFPIE